MKKILIYAGTTEGRLLAQKLAERGVSSVVCVATEYGQQVMQETEEPEEITVRQGRLLPDQMQAMLREEEFLAVVDATHPFATVVTENILQSLVYLLRIICATGLGFLFHQGCDRFFG